MLITRHFENMHNQNQMEEHKRDPYNCQNQVCTSDKVRCYYLIHKNHQKQEEKTKAEKKKRNKKKSTS